MVASYGKSPQVLVAFLRGRTARSEVLVFLSRLVLIAEGGVSGEITAISCGRRISTVLVLRGPEFPLLDRWGLKSTAKAKPQQLQNRNKKRSRAYEETLKPQREYQLIRVLLNSHRRAKSYLSLCH